jgi:hypothetical protein
MKHLPFILKKENGSYKPIIRFENTKGEKPHLGQLSFSNIFGGSVMVPRSLFPG